MRFTIDTSSLDNLRRGLANFSDRRFQSGLAEALNNTARAVRDEWGGQLYTRIDRPTQLTRSAVKSREKADVGRLRAVVGLNDDASIATPPSEYLTTLETGGDRAVKKFERALQAKGSMPAGAKAVPAQYAARDAFGNIRRQQIVQILNQLGDNLSVGYQRVIGRTAAKRALAVKRAGRVYVAVPRQQGKLAPGVYERKGKALLPVLFYVSRTRYRKVLELEERAVRVVQRELPVQVSLAMEKRLQSLLRRAGGGR